MEPSIEGDFAARELTRTDFDFLHAGLALSDVSRVCLLVLTGVLAVDVIAALMNWLDWPPGGHSHTLPIRVCAAQRGRDFEAHDLERGIHFRGVF